jgi:diaminohydroxyphosphoribosylaminopyrimidine deaminase/5-amino-6-(5-phosphoribosylamino)uracil reductase
MPTDADVQYMRHALSLARAQLGHVAPNPAVGCVIVKDGQIVGEGATGNGGRPHAEEIALDIAGTSAAGADVYVTLEPCSQRSAGGRPCARRLLGAGVARVFVAARDPHPQGSGLALLEEWGVPTTFGLCGDEAQAVNAGFFSLVETKRPLLVIGGDMASCDTDWDGKAEELEAALDAFGEQGVTRVWCAPGMLDVNVLKARGIRFEIG